jgi:cellobiose dehydrogenase (acceptor)
MVAAYQFCTIGGASAVNAGLYFQPPASDWDDYHPEGWHSADMQEALERLIERQPSVEYYSADGEFYLQSGYEAAYEWLVKGAGFKNVSHVEQPDGKEMAFGRTVFNYIDGQRGGPVRTYLQTALGRDNFQLQSGVHVDYIIQDNGKASAVKASTAGSEVTIKLSRRGRVVLSAGAILSPRILMYSGIGPEDILRNLSSASHTPYDSSNWIENDAVGVGLFDNPNTFIELSGPTIESYVQNYSDPIPSDSNKFLKFRSGPYTFASQTSAFWDYIQHDDGTRSSVQGTIDSSGYQDFTENNTITLNIYGTSGMLSSGRVVLTGENFTAGPNDKVYYSNPRDAEAISTFIYTIFQALPESTPELPAEKGLTPLNIPRNSTLEEIHEYITTSSPYSVGSVNHYSSSCRIGSCVDVNTKVIGTKNIHVIDASIIAPMTANPQFGIMMAAEKGVENILASLGEKCP